MNAEEVLRRIPKAELHLHLEGSVEAPTLADLARKHGVELPPHDDPAELYQYDSLADFLVIYSIVSSSVRDHDDFRRITYETLQRCARDGARYVELFFSPESHFAIGITYPEMLDTLDAAIGDGPWLLGDRFTMADVVLGGTMQWMLQFGMLEKRDRFTDYAARLSSRPARHRADARNAAALAALSA